MRVRIKRNKTIDSITIYQNDTGWLKAVKWDESGTFQYLIDIKNAWVYLDQKDFEFD
jgi:hypothetical protein